MVARMRYCLLMDWFEPEKGREIPPCFFLEAPSGMRSNKRGHKWPEQVGVVGLGALRGRDAVNVYIRGHGRDSLGLCQQFLDSYEFLNA